MNHKELRRECEPSLLDLLEERAYTELKSTGELSSSIDYGLIHRVLHNERIRELNRGRECARKVKITALEKRARKQAGQLAKRSNSFVTGKNLKRA